MTTYSILIRLVTLCLVLFSTILSVFLSQASTEDTGRAKQLFHARHVLDTLKGEWRFELIRAKEPNDSSLKGLRTFLPLHNELALEWKEEIDGLDVKITGVLGYDRERNEFYEFGLASVGPGEFSIGHWANGNREIVFVDTRATNEMIRTQTIFRLLSATRFEFVRYTLGGTQTREEWRAVFTRN